MNKLERAQEALRKTGLTFQCMTDEFGLTLGQIKNFMSGRLKKVPPEIEDVLVHKLHLSPAWLIDGSGQMYKTDVSLANIRDATHAAIEVVMQYAPLSQMLVTDMQQLAFEDGLSKDQLIEHFKDRLPQALVVESEMALLDNYRVAGYDDKRAIERMAELAAQSAKAKKPKT